MRTICLVILLLIISCSQTQTQGIDNIKINDTIKTDDGVKIQQFPENDMFYSEVNVRASKIKYTLDSLDAVRYNYCLRDIMSKPIVFDTLTKDFHVTYNIRN